MRICTFDSMYSIYENILFLVKFQLMLFLIFINFTSHFKLV